MMPTFVREYQLWTDFRIRSFRDSLHRVHRQFHAMFMSLPFFFLCAVCFSILVSSGGPSHPPTKGAVWPKPKTQSQQDAYYKFDPETFNVQITGKNCTILANRIRHYIYKFNEMKKISEKYEDVQRGAEETITKAQITETTTKRLEMGNLLALKVNLQNPCEQYPYLDMDESYNLKVSATAELTGSSLWGILHGLETFSQMFYFTDNFAEIRINVTEIADSPAYKHRGLLLDTSRHFIPVKDILTTIDAMAMNKMNVFHWHIVDDQSFPYQSEKFPDLSVRGAYHKSMVYSKSDIEMIIEFATERGVRVLPEFDVPGHTQSWGVAYPNLLTECYDNGKVIGLGPMNPVRNTTYKLIRDLFREVQDLFPDHYIHVGGDEVELDCWRSNPEIQKWMTEHELWSPSQLHSYFMSRTVPLLQPRSDAIVWQDVFDEGVTLTNDTLIQVWQASGNPGWHMFKALRQGFRVLFSSSWYLDHLTKTFENMLQVDPREIVRREGTTDLNNLIGGEACMWAENVDETNLHSRVWPRASAVAERLWHGPEDKSERAQTLRRAEEHVCRMKRRGIPASPSSGPGFCLS